MKKFLSMLCLTIAIFFLAQNSQAHMLWINSSNPAPQTKETVYLKLGFGHDYPGNKLVRQEQLSRVYALDSKGEQVDLNKIFPGFYKFTPKKQGLYIIQAEMHPGFISMTPDGHKKGSKKEHKDAKSCFRYHMNAGTVIQTQESRKQKLQPGNNNLRLIPVNTPLDIDVGDNISFMVLFNGERTENVNVLGTFKGSEKSWVQEDTSNSKGLVKFKIDQKGPWLFQAKHTTSFEDRSVCDKHTYKSTVTVNP